ncbi:MAG: SDR family oxidoreductase [Rhizomicrobium sp.]
MHDIEHNRLVLVGAGSFIARHVYAASLTKKIKAVGLPHDADLARVLHANDTVINFGLTPEYKTSAYSEKYDFDLRIARIANASGARVIMLSTRKVYPTANKWGSKEAEAAEGDGCFYGCNKARSEALIHDLMGQSLTILRCSNVFGYEYVAGQLRRTFFGQMLAELREMGTITFDMSPNTRRDFLPVEQCAGAIIAVIMAGASGVYNVGCGFPIFCGDVANWIMAGYGEGTLVISRDEIRDEFFLDMTKWQASNFPVLVTQDTLRSYCVDLGRRLRSA